MMHGHMIDDGVPALGAEFHIQIVHLGYLNQEGLQCTSFLLPLSAFPNR